MVDVTINVTPISPTPTKPTISSGTNFTVDTPTIEGTTTPRSEVEISVGTSVIGTGVADGSGRFSIVTSVLAEGNHGIKVEATNPSDRTKKSHENQNIVIQKPLSLSPVSIDTASSSIERGTANPQVVLKDAVV